MIKTIKLFAMLWAVMAFGQDNAVGGEISAVKADGLYRIRVPHKIRSYAATDLRDFRIWDTKGVQVPYFVEPTNAYGKTEVSDFTEFTIISNTRKKDTSATYIFKNPYKTIEQAVLLIANYQGSKSYLLEGSNDQKQWFGIVNSGRLNQLNHPTQASLYKVIRFPLCTYSFLKIVFDDRQSLPINLLKIGKATTETASIVPLIMEDIPVKTIEFQEKDQKTQIHIRFENPEVISQIRMDIAGPDLYSRNATFYTLQEREVKHKMELYRKPLAMLSIRSNNDLIFDIPTCKEKEVYLEIDNKDNPKLQISGIHFMQEPIYLVASLKTGEKYNVTAGNQKLNQPEYDISYVTNTLKSTLPITQISSIAYSKPVKTSKSTILFWQQPWFMWCCIGFAALIILYFAFNLLKELNINKGE